LNIKRKEKLGGVGAVVTIAASEAPPQLSQNVASTYKPIV